MAAPIGNQFWKLRSKHGRYKLFNTPGLLWDAACEYFEWCDNTPWIERKEKDMPNGVIIEESPTQRPYSLSGLLLYVDANHNYWDDFKKAGHKDFSGIITRIEQIIETQQMEGAIVGAFNPNIVARKLGLSDKQEITGKDGKDLIPNLTINVIESPAKLSNSEDKIDV